MDETIPAHNYGEPARTDDGGPAFPTGLAPGHYSQEGISLRDYFAGQALAGILARPDIVGTEARLQHVKGVVVDLSYSYADAMLAARGAK